MSRARTFTTNGIFVFFIALLIALVGCEKANTGDPTTGDDAYADVTGGGGTGSGGMTPGDPGEGDQGGETEYEAGQLTAGEWSDRTNWSFWTNLLTSNSNFFQAQTDWGFYTTERFTALVSFSNGAVCDATVTLNTTMSP